MNQKPKLSLYEKAVTVLLTVITALLSVGISYVSGISDKVDLLMQARAADDARITSNEKRIDKLENRYDRYPKRKD